MLESKRRAAIFIFISLLLAAVAGYLIFRQVQTLTNQLGGMAKVYVAAKNIPSRTLIKAEDVKTMDIPNKFVTSSHVTDPATLINQVSVTPLSTGDLITKNILRPVSNVQNENNRLVAIYSSTKINFDQQLEALDRVDIIVSRNENGKPVTDVFMKDVLVSTIMGSDNKFAGIGVEVSEEDAPRLIHMENYADQIRVLKANVGKGDTSPAGKAEASPNALPNTAKSPASPANPPKPVSVPSPTR
jgi:pilus assembly protein CpaB